MLAEAFNLAHTLDAAIARAAAQTPGFDPSFEPDVRPSDPRHGDLQANGVLPFAKRLKQNPRALATALAEHLEPHGGLDPHLLSWEIAGPGFINFRFAEPLLSAWLRAYRSYEALAAGAKDRLRGHRIVIDYASPNVGKQLHVGHLRSMVIGEAAQRLVRFHGADVVRDNHLGDWGTIFGLLILALKREPIDWQALDPTAQLDAIEARYKTISAAAKDDPAVTEAARQELVALQNGEPANSALWERIVATNRAALQQILDRFGIQFDTWHGESFYRDKVQRVYDELTAIGLAEESDGALVVFHPEHPRFKKQPFIIRKRDGASNYATTDLAGMLYRVEHERATDIFIVTDNRQSDHFEQLVCTSRKWFAQKGYPHPRFLHLAHGMVLGEDKKPLKTRAGDTVKLKALLDEAELRARAVAEEKNPALPEDEKDRVGQVVGIGAVRYFDLAQNRTSDYIFTWERILSLEGNTAPYLLYAIARLHAIFRKAERRPGEGENEASPLDTDEELALARKLVAFPLALDQALADLRPHVLCTYLYELAQTFSSFYNANKVLGAETSIQARRLRLCARTLLTLETGLHLLGLETLERM